MSGLTASPQDFVNRLQEIEQIVDTSDLLLNDELQATQKWGFLWIVRVIAQPFFCCCDLFADVRITAVSTEFRHFLQRNKTFHFAPGRNQELSPQATILSQRIVTKLQERSHHRYDALIQRILEPFAETDPQAQPRYFRDQVQDGHVRHMRDLGDIRNSATETLNALLNDPIRPTRSARQTPPRPEANFFAHNNMEDLFDFHFEAPPMPEMPRMEEPFAFHFEMPPMPEANVFSNGQPSDGDAWDRAFDEWDRAFTSNWNHAFRDSEERLRESEERLRRSREATDERLRRAREAADERLSRSRESAEERIRQAEERLNRQREATAEIIRRADEQMRQRNEASRQRLQETQERIRETMERTRQAREARNASSAQQPSAPRPSASTPGAQQPSAPRATPSTEQAEQQERRRREEEAARERARFENLFRPGSDRVTSIEAELCRLFGCQQISSAAELSSAFRRWSRSNHPDRVPPERQQEATALFQQVSEKVAQLRTARQWT